ncbi:Oidioi.mRNA.OKI2018_I69.chr1.g604.t1.cds [Oikopleura dioica]|uniref:Oidioi.mRNA.OKI2018_I69.chr1.g604.t1.cds n=1 Tax=Oikopleura dioica TaxID=34765 RepID=A0ABN7SP13_OIKDI|nr:Oidioi.mRNA.OKI2018_I69.chr1.g604.t1.cds [Oikopleura dioica]
MTGGDYERVDHETAQSRCEDIGGYLSFFLTQDELDHFNNERETLGRKEWLGIVKNQTTQVWQTVTGINNTIFDWTTNEPNNVGGVENCIERYTYGTWNDEPCNQLETFSCRLEELVPDHLNCSTDYFLANGN